MQISRNEHLAEVETWYQDRLRALKAEDGWLHLTDRIDIVPGRYSLGQGDANQIRISAGPAALGLLELAADGQATLHIGDRVLPFTPVPDAPPRLRLDGLLLEMMNVEGQHALRVRDLTLPQRVAFPGIPRYPVDPAWRITARWERLASPKPLGISLVGGIDSAVQISHLARFHHAGATLTLLPTHWKSGKPMFVFRDATAGTETYAASRFLIGEVSGDHVTLDFNKAFNPPCAFTDLAVCPLPPRENILPFPIRAGEMAPDLPANA